MDLSWTAADLLFFSAEVDSAGCSSNQGQRDGGRHLYLAPRKTGWYYSPWHVSTEDRSCITPKSDPLLRHGSSCSVPSWHNTRSYTVHAWINLRSTLHRYVKRRREIPDLNKNMQIQFVLLRSNHLTTTCVNPWDYISTKGRHFPTIMTKTGMQEVDMNNREQKVRITGQLVTGWVNHRRRAMKPTHGLTPPCIQPFISNIKQVFLLSRVYKQATSLSTNKSVSMAIRENEC